MVKVKPAEIARRLADPGPDVRAILIYGPDAGLVTERADGLRRRLAGEQPDPFSFVALSGDVARGDPARLYDEAAQVPLMGGVKVMDVRDAGDALADPMAAVLESDLPVIMIVRAGDLPPRSKLRRLAESAPRALAIPCYADAARDLEALARATLGQAAGRIDPDARHYLLQNLGGDRLLSRAELEKLRLYMNIRDDAPPPRITLEDVRAVVTDAAGLEVEAIAGAALDGNVRLADREFARALAADIAPVAVIRAVLRRLLRLHQASLARRDGMSVADAVKALRPPVFWKERRAYEQQVSRWPVSMLERGLALALEAEVECKSGGVPAEAACGRALLRLAQAGAKLA